MPKPLTFAFARDYVSARGLTLQRLNPPTRRCDCYGKTLLTRYQLGNPLAPSTTRYFDNMREVSEHIRAYM